MIAFDALRTLVAVREVIGAAPDSMPNSWLCFGPPNRAWDTRNITAKSAVDVSGLLHAWNDHQPNQGGLGGGCPTAAGPAVRSMLQRLSCWTCSEEVMETVMCWQISAECEVQAIHSVLYYNFEVRTNVSVMRSRYGGETESI